MNGGESRQRKSTKPTTSTRDLSRLSSLRTRPSSTPSGSFTSLPNIEVRVPWVPPYIPNLTTPVLPHTHFTIRDRDHDEHCRNGTVLSRYTKENGTIGFTVRIRHGLARELDEEDVEINLAQIYEYVTPEELERYENHDWELEDERERNRPKLGRPRIKPTIDGSDLPAIYWPKRPRGRPPKGSAKRQFEAGKKTGSTFVAVHVPSPMKPGEVTSTDLSTVSTRSTPIVQFGRELTASSMEDVLSPHDKVLDIQVDPLSPSNANRVVAMKSSDPSPSKRYKSSYSMVQAALGDSESSDEGEVVLNSGSEDELTLIPTKQRRRFSAGAEVANSMPDKDGGDEELFLTPVGSQSSPSQNSYDDRVAPVQNRSPLNGSISSSSDDVTDLLQQFQASKTRCAHSISQTRLSPKAVRPPILVDYIDRQSPVKRSAMPAGSTHEPSAPSESQGSQLGFISGLKKVVSNTFRSPRAIQPPPTSPERPHQNSIEPAPPSATTPAPITNAVNPSQTVRRRQGQLPWGSTNKKLSPKAPIQTKSTPPSSPSFRHSMTPHFPRSQRPHPHQNHISPSLRGGITHAPAPTRGPNYQHHTNPTSSPLGKTIMHKGHAGLSVQNYHPKSSVWAGDIILGDLESSPAKNDHDSPHTKPSNHFSSAKRKVDGEITLGDLETSSEEDYHPPPSNMPIQDHSPGTGRGIYGRGNQEIKLGSPITSSSSSEDTSISSSTSQTRHDPPPKINLNKKRPRTLSDNSGQAGGGNWYRMVRR